MPRVNPNRSLQNERNLAERIGFEREKRGWSYESTAKRMTDLGFPMQASAVFKIEKGEPPRRITVDELVGFAQLFDIKVEEILEPVQLMYDKRGREITGEIKYHTRALQKEMESLARRWADWFNYVSSYQYDEPASIETLLPTLHPSVIAAWQPFTEDELNEPVDIGPDLARLTRRISLLGFQRVKAGEGAKS